MGRERIGRFGEAQAAAYLARKGYKILERNFRTFFGEIDVIADLGDLIVFVEVKTRLGSSLGPPYLSVTRTKKARLIRSALSYLKARRLAGADWRIDVVSVKLKNEDEVGHMELIENAVEDCGGMI